MTAAAQDGTFPFPIPPAPPSVRPRSAPFTIPPSARAAETVMTRPSFTDLSARVGKWTLDVPYPLLFVAGAAVGILFASLVVLFTHSTPKKTTNLVAANAMVVPAAPVATWQPNVITIHPAPDPMFDTPPSLEPASLAVPAARNAPPKKAVTRNAVRRGRAASKPAAAGDLLTAAL